MTSEEIKKHFDTHGVYILKSAFTKEEIDQLRADSYAQLEIDKQRQNLYQVPKSKATYVRGDLLSKEKINRIVTDDRILNLVRTVLGNDNIVYFGDGSYQIGVGLRGYHRDNIDRTYNEGQDWEGNYNLIRVGLYLQDHKKYSGGLKVRPGTHLSDSGKSTILDIEVGDVVIWNLKTVHSGNAVRLKLFPNLPVDYLERLVPKFLKVDEQKERIAFFFSYGLKGKHLDRYFEKYLRVNQGMVENLKRSNLSPETIQITKDKKLELVKPIPEYGGF